jgi:Ca2+-binding EF-hand superfamily protein
MKSYLFISIIAALALRAPAQTNGPVRLAMISESGDASAAVDVLTAELSSHANLQLLERNEIEKVYREQGLSAGNKDYLKLGQILGADGLLLMETVKEDTNQFLNIRLVAVKPGVVLVAEQFSWPMTNLTEWSPAFARHLDLFLPKLTVPAKDALPISVVNLRSAIASAEALETERQLKLLALQRLSREPQIFVLEREQMQLLGEEKELKLDDSPFWNGSYLLEGVVDQNGHSQETITINARLTPPKGGSPLAFAVAGSRTNLADVINQLAAKVDEALKVSSNVKAWDAADEAAQYFEEAKWALRWGIHPEAQAAADSAWALGKHDMDCVTARVQAYEVVPDTGGYQKGEYTNPDSTNQVIQSAVSDAAPNHLWGLIWNERMFAGVKVVQYVSVSKSPDPKSLDSAMRALELYYEYSQTLPPDEPKAGSAWYLLGIEDLSVASQVLQHFQFVPESQAAAADKLAALRALARTVAGWISRPPSVHDSYFVGDRAVSYDELYHFEESPSIFHCQLEWGYLWQEKPEDAAALYRELMSSPVFCYIHNDLWFRELQSPRLTAWNEQDRKRVPTVWNDFVQELNDSTNVLLKLEAKAITLADADDEKQMAASFTNLFNCFFENRDALVANNVEVLYVEWHVGDLIERLGGGLASDVKDSLQHVYYSEYRPKLEAMDQEYRRTISQRQTMSLGGAADDQPAAFEKQKKYLTDNQPFEPQEFVQLFIFGFKDYTKAQALEIQPLLAAYKTKLTGQWARMGTMQVAQVERNVNQILNPSAPAPRQPVQTQIARPAPVAKQTEVPPVANNRQELVPNKEIVTNILTVNQFLEIPLDSLIQLSGLGTINSSQVTITAHHWLEGKLLLNFEYSLLNNQYGAADGSAIAVLDPATEHWSVISCPKEDVLSQNNFYHRTTLMHGEVFNCDGGQIKKYDFQSQQWQVLAVSDGNNYELFAINGHLYAAGRDTIFEVLDGGKSTRILASTRRNPPASALDREVLGTPTLFEGPNHALRACTSSKIFTWTGDDWHEDSAAPPASFPPVISEDGVLFRTDGFNLPASVSGLATETNAVEFLLGQKARPPGNAGFHYPGANPPEQPGSSWKLPPELSLANLPAARRQSDLCLLVDHSGLQEIANDQHLVVQEKVLPQDGYSAALLYFSHDLPSPQKLFLKFDSPDGGPPVTGINPGSHQMMPSPPPAWLLFSTNFLIFGLEKSSSIVPNGADRAGIGYKTGIWLMPVAQIETAFAAQKQIQLEKKTLAVAAAEQAQKSLLAKYDLNHNGIIDPDEKEAALDDPAFIASELDVIDANHNGWLDAAELVYFDANKNKILEPKEQAGIEIAQHLLAERLLKKFDANGDGWLDRTEFNELVQACMDAGAQTRPGLAFQFPDVNGDGHVDLGELETFLKQQTRSGLRSHRMPGAMFSNQMIQDPNQPVDPQQLFKASVEAYWQNPGGTTRRVSPGAGMVPNGVPQNAPQ